MGQVRFDDKGVSFLMVTGDLGNRLSIRPWGKIAIFFHFTFAFNYKLTEKAWQSFPNGMYQRKNKNLENIIFICVIDGK